MTEADRAWANETIDEADLGLNCNKAVKSRSMYIIKCENQGKILYYQHIAKGGYWTQFKENALAFDTEVDAKRVIKKFKYGKFSILKI